MTQYYEKSNGYQYNIQNDSAYGSTLIYTDLTPYPAHCNNPLTGTRCVLDTDIQAEVQRMMSIYNLPGGVYNHYFVYTALGEGSCFNTTCTSASYYQKSSQGVIGGYCAYHYSFYNASKGTWVLYANMPYASNNTYYQDCNNFLSKSPNGSFNIDSEISSTSHEQFEMVTDPYGGIYNNAYDAWTGGLTGNPSDEIGDKCNRATGPLNWDYGQANQYWHGHYYAVQTEFSDGALASGVSAAGTPIGCVQQG
jgi:hypothetical protein